MWSALEGKFLGDFGQFLVVWLGAHIWGVKIFLDASEGKNVDVYMRHVKTKDLKANPFVWIDFFETPGYFFDGLHQSNVVIVRQVLKFVNLPFWNYQNMAVSFWMDV